MENTNTNKNRNTNRNTETNANTSNFFALISRMKYINRWVLMRNSYPENIEGHSLQVAMIAHALALIKNERFGGNISADRIALYAMYHDANEILTGDMPTPVKYYGTDIIKAYKDVEKVSRDRLLSLIPDGLKKYYKEIFFYDENEENYIIVKAADKISAYIKCLEELKAGNNEFREASKSIKKFINDLDLPEVNYFMEVFLPGFELTLDEIEL